MKRIEKKLKELSQDNQKAFVGYIVAGDPDLETSLELMHLSVDSGVDILEIGVPFTDPIAEGPTIQQAHDRSLENETNLQKIIDLVCKFREKDINTPIILMGYINNFLIYTFHSIRQRDGKCAVFNHQFIKFKSPIFFD